MNIKCNNFCFLFDKWTDESAWYCRVVVRFGKYVGTAGTNATYRYCKSPLFTSLLLPFLSHPPIRSPSRLYYRSRPSFSRFSRSFPSPPLKSPPPPLRYPSPLYSTSREVHNLFSPLSTLTSHFHSPCPSSSLALYIPLFPSLTYRTPRGWHAQLFF